MPKLSIVILGGWLQATAWSSLTGNKSAVRVYKVSIKVGRIDQLLIPPFSFLYLPKQQSFHQNNSEVKKYKQVHLSGKCHFFMVEMTETPLCGCSQSSRCVQSVVEHLPLPNFCWLFSSYTQENAISYCTSILRSLTHKGTLSALSNRKSPWSPAFSILKLGGFQGKRLKVQVQLNMNILLFLFSVVYWNHNGTFWNVSLSQVSM